MVRQDDQSIAAVDVTGIVSTKTQQWQGLRGYRERGNGVSARLRRA